MTVDPVVYKLDGLLGAEEVATKLKISLKTVRIWVYLRKIPFTKLGRRVYFAVGVVEDLLRRNAVPAIPTQQRASKGSNVSVSNNAENGGATNGKDVNHG
jgi:excisionase family DNA binding protein